MAEQRYQAVMAVIGDGLSISQVAEKVGMPLTISHTGRATRAVHFGRDE